MFKWPARFFDILTLTGGKPECELLTVAFPCCKSSSWQFKSYPPGPPRSRLTPYPPAQLFNGADGRKLGSLAPPEMRIPSAGPAGISVHWLPRPRPPVWPRCRSRRTWWVRDSGGGACPAGARSVPIFRRCFTSETVGLRTRLSFQCAELSSSNPAKSRGCRPLAEVRKDLDAKVFLVVA